MARPSPLDDAAVAAWVAAHPGWNRIGDALERTFPFDDFAGPLAFAVAVGCAAERRDHHPTVIVDWGRALVRWTTHDPAGVTSLDLELAEASDRAFDKARK